MLLMLLITKTVADTKNIGPLRPRVVICNRLIYIMLFFLQSKYTFTFDHSLINIGLHSLLLYLPFLVIRL